MLLPTMRVLFGFPIWKAEMIVMQTLIELLRNGAQLDSDGVMVRVSRQACEEAASIIEELQLHRDADKSKFDKFDIAEEFCAGYAAGVQPQQRLLSESGHWLAGWDAGYYARDVRTLKLNAYLTSLGVEEIHQIMVVSPVSIATPPDHDGMCGRCGRFRTGP